MSKIEKCQTPIYTTNANDSFGCHGTNKSTTYKFDQRYVMIFMYDATRYVWAMENKKMVTLYSKKCLRMQRKYKENIKITFVLSDNGTEYTTDEMERIMEKERF